jgi:uncharacterized protein with GYD domain
MATFIALVDYTEQGIRTIQDSPERAEGFAARAKQAGVTVKELFWTSGAHDGVLILDAPDDETVSSVMLALARTGNVRTHTLRAYGRDEMKRILAGSE